jgi:hypothetical protein
MADKEQKLFHALTAKERDILLNSGFLKSEIRVFDSAKTPDGEVQNVAFTSTPFQRMIQSRRDWVKKCHAANYDNATIRQRLVDHYKAKKGRTPWDFLKAEYQPIDRDLTDTEFSNKLGIRSGIRRNLVNKTGVAYGTPMEAEFRPQGDRMPVPKSSLPIQPTKSHTPKPLMPVAKPKVAPVAPGKPRKKPFRI